MDGNHAVGNVDIGHRAAWLQVIQRYGQGEYELIIQAHGQLQDGGLGHRLRAHGQPAHLERGVEQLPEPAEHEHNELAPRDVDAGDRHGWQRQGKDNDDADDKPCHQVAHGDLAHEHAPHDYQPDDEPRAEAVAQTGKARVSHR